MAVAVAADGPCEGQTSEGEAHAFPSTSTGKVAPVANRENNQRVGRSAKTFISVLNTCSIDIGGLLT